MPDGIGVVGHHRERHRRVQDHREGVRVGRGVPLRDAVDVGDVDGSRHRGHPGQPGVAVGSLGREVGEVGERTEREHPEPVDRAGERADQLRRRCRPGHERGVQAGQSGAARGELAPLGRPRPGRVLAAAGDRHTALAERVDQVGDQVDAVGAADQAGAGDRDRLDADVRAAEHERQCHQVVAGEVGVDHDRLRVLVGCGRRGQGAGGRELAVVVVRRRASRQRQGRNRGRHPSRSQDPHNATVLCSTTPATASTAPPITSGRRARPGTATATARATRPTR